jgi:coproporphyrinogen III oxidase
MKDIFDDRKSRASAWFRSLRDDIVAAFEALEDAQGGEAPAGRFEVSKRAAAPRTDRTRAVV